MAATASSIGPRFSKVLGSCIPPIENHGQLKRYVAEVNRLMDKDALSSSESRYLSLLSLVISDYEKRLSELVASRGMNCSSELAVRLLGSLM